jgi:hypothetical protein
MKSKSNKSKGSENNNTISENSIKQQFTNQSRHSHTVSSDNFP